MLKMTPGYGYRLKTRHDTNPHIDIIVEWQCDIYEWYGRDTIDGAHVEVFRFRDGGRWRYLAQVCQNCVEA